MSNPLQHNSNDSQGVSLGKINALLCGSLMPYGADAQELSYYGSTNNIHTITFKRDGVTLATRTFTYQGGGSVDNDKLTGIQDA